MCDAPGVDPLVIAVIALETLLLAALAGVAISRGRRLSEIRARLDSGRPAQAIEIDPAESVRRLRLELDMTERELARQRRDAARLAEMVGAGVIRLDGHGRVDAANPAAHRLLARPPASMLGRTPLEAFADTRIERIVETAMETGSASGEVTSRDVDGATLLVRANRTPDGEVWVVLEDVGELRRLQRIRAEFIDNLSHELRTPLTTVGLLAETLVRDAAAAGETIPRKMRDRIDKIEVETGHLVQMVSELLDLSRIESGRAPLQFDDVDLARLAIASTERLRLFAERQGVRLVVDAPDSVPPVRGDEDRLAQVFVNLLHNAVKFSSQGGTVTVRVATEGDEIVAAVVDEGIGIAKADQARIFERFYKVDRARVHGGGTGLGLAIVRHVIEGHGGRAWVESEEGRGSAFFFTLPVSSAVPAVVPVGAASA
jgi:two-component system phosphate regulon sensor histidine kinase PhoR